MNQSDIKKQIEDYFHQHHRNYNLPGYRNTKILEFIESTLGPEKLESLFQNKELFSKVTGNPSTITPTHILKFIKELIKSEDIKSIFDPWLTVVSPALYMQTANIFGICYSAADFEVIKFLFNKNSKNIKLGNPIKEPLKSAKKFDLVLSFPPFYLRTHYLNNGIKTPFDVATMLLLKYSNQLEHNGKLIFIVSNRFLIDKKGKEELTKQGLFVDAVFAIPSGVFSPQTSIPAILIIVSKQRKQETFIAEISQDEKTNDIILRNYKNLQKGKTIQLGNFVNFMEFQSLSALTAEKDMLDLAKRIGYPETQLTDISTSIIRLKGNNIEEVQHLANSFYLPTVGNSPVVANFTELKIKPKNYFQIQLDETKANAIYVANYFNSPIGKKLRASLETGTVIQNITKKRLLNCVLFLPDLPTQAKLIEIDSKIKQTILILDELKRNLWKQPRRHKEIAKELKSINQEKKLESWIDKLPFPLSSILWRYYATKENSKKIEHLFHFFEAFSQFLSMIMLSALVQDKHFYDSECHNWIDKDEKFQNWYLNSTFGSWNVLTSRLSKTIRRFLSEKETKEYCENLLGNPTDAFISMITSKEIVNILQDVAVLRNKWKGHGGISSKETNTHRVLLLEQKLNEIRERIADAFEETRILSPTIGSYEDGVHTFYAKELTGVRTPFNEIAIESRIPLDKNKLYLYHSGQTNPFELLPFIKFVENSNAIYFYTSVEGNGVRWVSYHFEKKPEIMLPADTMMDVFKYFKK
jgi:hypothetical protein